MADESYNFTTARTRLEEIVTQVRKKDTSLEKSLDLLEEGVRLANACTELIDRADWAAAGAAPEGATAEDAGEMLASDDGANSAPEVSADETGSDEPEANDDMTSADDADQDEAPEFDVAQDEAAEER